MEAKILRRDRLPELVDAMVREHEVIGPRDELAYGPIVSSAELNLDCEKPARPLKEFFFRPREVLLEYRLGADDVMVVMPPSLVGTSRIVFGARPCDAAALPILDKLFGWDYMDSPYLERRQTTTIVTLACDKPCDACFCTSLGGSPAGIEGSDLLLTPLGDGYHVQIISDRGQELVAKYGSFFEESDQQHDRERMRLEDAWCEGITKTVDTEGLASTLDFESKVWESVTEQCVDCGICTFLCPTCHCFDIQDEGDPESGQRVRLWDSCAFRSFTQTAVHQPRPTHASRYRQRIMHKFQYYPKNFGRVLCVGCGRCIQHCPVSIDLREVLTVVKEPVK